MIFHGLMYFHYIILIGDDMSGNKTEKPTRKKLKDSAKKGQIFKSRDLIVTIIILIGILYLIYSFSIGELMAIILDILNNLGTERNLHQFTNVLFFIFTKIVFVIVLVCILATIFPSLFQASFIMATKALKLNFNAFNPVNGLKKIFSLRNLKDLIKAILYLCSFVAALYIAWGKDKGLLFSQLNTTPNHIILIWGEILQSLLFIIIFSILIVLSLDTLAEYFLYIKEQKMDKQEVKREHKEQEANPEMKSRRRSLHQELLSEQDQINIKQSKAIIVNPTHIAVGIFFEPDILPAPVISLVEKNQRALLTKKFAEKHGVPVIQDIPLARRLFKTHAKYNLVSFDELDAILRILVWLKDVEDNTYYYK